MSDRPGEKVPSETASAWDTVRRVREPVAWTLLLATAIVVVAGAWQLLGLPGDRLMAVPAGIQVLPASQPANVPIPVFHLAGASFALRASDVAPTFVSGTTFTLPVLSVILVAFAGGLTDRARQAVQTAVGILAVSVGLGLISWLGAFGAHQRQGIWFISDAVGLAVVAAGLVFAVAVLRSRALRPVTRLADSVEDSAGWGADGADVAERVADFGADAGEDVADFGEEEDVAR